MWLQIHSPVLFAFGKWDHCSASGANKRSIVEGVDKKLKLPLSGRGQTRILFASVPPSPHFVQGRKL
jgi:hypothetical protein